MPGPESDPARHPPTIGPVTTTWRSRIVVSGLAVCAFVISLVVGNVFFENLSMNNDEAVYVLQAQMFAGGDVNLSDAAHGDAFRPWMSGRVDGDRLVLVAQPILPGLMALSDLLFGTMRVALAAVAAAAVVAVYAATRALLGRDPVALVAAGCFVLSPLVMVQSAMYVSYVLAVAIGATALTLVTRGVDAAVEGRRWSWWIVGGGLAEGLLLFTRPLEGIVTGFLLVGWMWLRSGRWRLLGRTVPVLALSAVPVLVVVFTYNAFTTGDPFTFALWAIGGDDSFGFGYRAIAEYFATSTSDRARRGWRCGPTCGPIPTGSSADWCRSPWRRGAHGACGAPAAGCCGSCWPCWRPSRSPTSSITGTT